MADDLTKKEITAFEAEYLAKYKEAGTEVRTIELKNIRTSLNGYSTPEPLNQKAKELEMVVFLSSSPEKSLRIFEESIGRHFNSGNIKFSSFVMSTFAVARDMFVHQDNFLLVDIGGEVTDISMIKKDILSESISFPSGRNLIIRGVAHALQCSFEESRSLISLYEDGHAEATIQKKIEPVIAKLKSEWLLEFQESLTNLSNDISIPSTVFVTVDTPFANFFTETIKVEQLSQYTLTESKFRIIFLGTKELHGIALFEGDTERDPFIIIESIYINRFLR